MRSTQAPKLINTDRDGMYMQHRGRLENPQYFEFSLKFGQSKKEAIKQWINLADVIWERPNAVDSRGIQMTLLPLTKRPPLFSEVILVT